MARQRLAVGTHGVVNLCETSPGRFRARVRYRDRDGVLRYVSGFGASKGAANAALQESLKRRQPSGRGEVTGETPMSTLAEIWLASIEANTGTAARHHPRPVLARADRRRHRRTPRGDRVSCLADPRRIRRDDPRRPRLAPRPAARTRTLGTVRAATRRLPPRRRPRPRPPPRLAPSTKKRPRPRITGGGAAFRVAL